MALISHMLTFHRLTSCKPSCIPSHLDHHDVSLDQASLDLTIELQLEDARKLVKGKHRTGETPDGELAAELDKLELESLATFRADQAISRSIARAVLSDAEVIQDHVEEERQAGRPPTAVDKRRCVACMADVACFETVRRPCSHEYCRACMADLFQSVIKDESLFPPRCCSQPIPLGLFQTFLPAESAGRYRAKELEYTTKDRTYCHEAACSTFIPTHLIRGEVATCVKCWSKTCTICKGSSHDGGCPQDVATMDLLNLAAENGWQRCYSCRRMVDLELGCNHISELLR
ncbi:IBR domain containing protein [Metarhizium album ARSEF 1941]|uniref:IBR domain containing protein n=1 Tax=Metarhizium album (strain ARSEF 1941) TaxID=1081103 RepID=A0A0B2WZM8_METAS|nr:IBR domain containing protein [Metarhizium album ARSEF 1941]KHN98270.1 IBR domain containing protein [Metarhizium album ARSEF 1941]